MTSTIDTTIPTEETAQRFEAILTVEGVQTGDHRYIAVGALDWRDLPLSLMLQKQTPAGGMGGNPHAGALAAGRIEEIERVPQPDGTVQIVGRGTFDAGTDGQEAFRMVGDGTIRGVSVDLTNVVAEPECLSEDADGECADGRDVFTQGRIMGATITPFQAIEPATIALAASLAAPGADIWTTDEAGDRLTTPPLPFAAAPDAPPLASGAAAPLVPPVEWFQAPAAVVPMQITPEGRIYGYLGQWGSCHRGFVNGAFNKCVTLPPSKANYALFTKLGGQLAQCCGDCEPEEITVGSLVFDTTHADLSLAWKNAKDFYEHTGKVAAHIAVGEDEHGVWFSGALNPSLTPEQVWTLRGAKVSGDWRRYGSGLELTSILAVSTEGFPIMPKVGFADNGEMLALVASLAPTDETPVAAGGPSWSDFNALRNLVDELRAQVQPALAAVDALGLADQAADLIESRTWEAAGFADITTAERKKAAADGAAMPDGSFPIRNQADLQNAVHAIGRTNNPDAVKAHIRKRAAALNLTAWLKEHAPSIAG